MRNKYQEALGYIADNFIDNIEVKDGKPMNKETKCVMTLQELVNKETPKKLSEAKIPYSIEIPAYMVVKTCPKCNRKFDYRNMGVNYCSSCGQKLDWSE